MHTRPERRRQGGGLKPSDGRPWLLLALGAALLGGALATPAAAATKPCTKSCTASFRACLAGVRQERATLRAACTAGSGGLRACRTRVGAAGRAETRACRALRRQCRACCRSSGQSCEQPQAVRDDSHAANG